MRAERGGVGLGLAGGARCGSSLPGRPATHTGSGTVRANELLGSWVLMVLLDHLRRCCLFRIEK